MYDVVEVVKDTFVQNSLKKVGLVTLLIAL
jgi:hypothetical protein